MVVPFLSLAVTENGLWLQTNCDICGFKVQASLNRVHNSDIEYKYIYQKPNRAVWVEVLLWMNWMWVVPLGSGGCLSTWYWAAWPQSNPTSIKGLQLSNCKQRFSDQVFRHWRYFEDYHWLCQSFNFKSSKKWHFRASNLSGNFVKGGVWSIIKINQNSVYNLPRNRQVVSAP